LQGLSARPHIGVGSAHLLPFDENRAAIPTGKPAEL
jgi:hypothetical protein